MRDEEEFAADPKETPATPGHPPAFPPGPAWAVGADRDHRGPSGIGPGEDQPGFGQEIDEEDATGVTGGFLESGRETRGK